MNKTDRHRSCILGTCLLITGESLNAIIMEMRCCDQHNVLLNQIRVMILLLLWLLLNCANSSKRKYWYNLFRDKLCGCETSVVGRHSRQDANYMYKINFDVEKEIWHKLDSKKKTTVLDIPKLVMFIVTLERHLLLIMCIVKTNIFA